MGSGDGDRSSRGVLVLLLALAAGTREIPFLRGETWAADFEEVEIWGQPLVLLEMALV